jgi:ParB family chromosome partitioning protein
MSTSKYLTYRGDIRAVAAVGGSVAFVTTHPENQPTAVYRLNADKFTLVADALPCGGLALIATADALFTAGTDTRLYKSPAKGGAPAAWGPELPAPATALAALGDDLLAAAAGNAVHVIDRTNGKLVQTLEFAEPVTSLAGDPTGAWLAVGTRDGTVAVYEREGRPDFRVSEQAKLHEAAVTALLFETGELRFLSAGADQKLLTTHARGKLEPEDRGRGANHEQPIAAVVWGPGDRFITGGLDASVKSWPRQGAARPVTLKDGIARVVGLAVATVHDKPLLAVACADNSLRFVTFADDGRFEEMTVQAFDAYVRAKEEFGQTQTARREAAIRELAGYADAASMELIAERMKRDDDHALRLLAANLLSESAHARATKLLEGGLLHRDEAVRMAAFQGLRRHLGANELRPLNLALKAEKADIGKAAVQALEGLAARDDQAMARLVDALDNKVPDVRLAALDSLERVHPADSPEADLTALGSEHADVRRKSLVRLYQRKMLGHPPVQAALRRRGEDADPEVRRTSFLLALHTRPKLANALRSRDPEMQRQITELESGNLPPIATRTTAKPTGPANPTPPTGGAEIPAFLRPQLEAIAKMQGVSAERMFEALGLAARSNNPRDFVMALTTKLQEIVEKARTSGEGS